MTTRGSSNDGASGIIRRKDLRPRRPQTARQLVGQARSNAERTLNKRLTPAEQELLAIREARRAAR